MDDRTVGPDRTPLGSTCWFFRRSGMWMVVGAYPFLHSEPTRMWAAIVSGVVLLLLGVVIDQQRNK